VEKGCAHGTRDKTIAINAWNTTRELTGAFREGCGEGECFILWPLTCLRPNLDTRRKLSLLGFLS
jgi:hypothetical protein